MYCSTPGFPVFHHLPELAQTHVHQVGDATQPSRPLSPSPPAFNLSQHQGLFQCVSIRWPKYWRFSFSISPSSEYSGLISFRIGWLDLLAVQGTLKSLLQHHSSKASVLRHSAFFMVQLSHPYMTTGKTIALIRWIFVGKAMQETQVRSLGREDPLEKGMAIHSNILAWRIPWAEEPDGLQSVRSKRVRQDWVTNTFTFFRKTGTCIFDKFLTISHGKAEKHCVLVSETCSKTWI